jgi:hypothetical protein
VNSHPGSINQPAARNRLTYDWEDLHLRLFQC